MDCNSYDQTQTQTDTHTHTHTHTLEGLTAASPPLCLATSISVFNNFNLCSSASSNLSVTYNSIYVVCIGNAHISLLIYIK